MKKFLVAPVLVLAVLTLAVVPAIVAQAPASQPITIKDPAEFNAYQNATTQTDPKAKAAAIEAFLTQYPQSVVKNAMISDLVDAYAQIQPQDPAKIIDAAQRLLQVDPNNLKAIYLTAVMKQQLALANQAQAPQLMDDAAAMATKGLAATKPADVKDEDFKKQTSAIYPLFYSIISRDAIAKKDLPGAVTALRAELQYLAQNNPDATKISPAWNDTFFLGQTYTQLTPPDMVNGVWFLARAESFAPNPTAKAGIEKLAKYWYKRYHGKEDGYEDVLAKAATTIFPPPDFAITPAPTPKDIADGVVASTSDLATLALVDKEYILANASHDNAEKLWAILKDKATELPGTVMAATATQIQLAVTDDAKADKKADFTVNMKTPLADKDIPAVGSEIAVDDATETKALIGTFDSYTPAPNAMIIMRDGEIQVTKKKAPARKPSAAHHTTSH
jgi:hypothetical protein